MELSSILHKHINKGRKGRSDAGDAENVSLTDDQLMELWTKAMDLELDVACLLAGVERVKDMSLRSKRK